MAWITVADARRRLDGAVSLQTIYRLLHSGKLKGTKIAGRKLVDSDSLDALVDRGRVEIREVPDATPQRPGRRRKAS